MRKNLQTRMHTGNEPKQRGNCYPAVISCIMDLDSAEDVFQVQEHYHKEDWWDLMWNWLIEKGFEPITIKEHLFDDSFYFVSGQSPRFPKGNHICIYQNGKLYHDPHPDGTGIFTEKYFTILEKI